MCASVPTPATAADHDAPVCASCIVLAPLLLLPLAACSTLPRDRAGHSARDDARRRSKVARGPLPPARSRAILAGARARRRRHGHLRSPPRSRAGRDRTARSSAAIGSGCSRTGRTRTAPCSRPSRPRRDHINMETYILEDDEVGRRFADALIEKQRAGRAGEPDLRQRGHARHAGGVLPAPARQRHPHAASSIRSTRRRRRRAGR